MLQELGYELTDDELRTAFDRFKRLADKKKTITDADLEAVITDELSKTVEVYKLDGVQVACGTLGMPTATVRLIGPDGETHTVACVGTGPVDAAYKAVDEIIGITATLLEFNINAVTEGIDAIGEVTVRIEGENGGSEVVNPQRGTSWKRTFGGHGTSTDIIVASVRAYLAALNKLLAAKGYAGQPAEEQTEVAGGVAG